MRALNTAVSGIRAQQTAMDVLANNIANVNTVGFKGSRVTFTDVFTETVATGGRQPQQIGLGSAVASVDRLFTPGSLQLTGRDLDFAVQGQGFFITRSPNGAELHYTRAGAFDWDAEGYLINTTNGERVQGYLPGPDGAVQPGAELTDIRIQRGVQVAAIPTTRAVLAGNLDLTATTYQTGLTVYDSLGRHYVIQVNFTKIDDNTWEVQLIPPDGITLNGDDTFEITFDTMGRIELSDPADPDLPTFSFDPDGAEPVEVTLDITGLTSMYAGPGGSTVKVMEVNGAPGGVLESVRPESDGSLWGVFSNGERRLLAWIALATFPNEGGLQTFGSTNFVATPASGQPDIGVPGTGSRGRLSPGNLEMANVDLSDQFSKVILTQRAYQANTRVVTTADEMLEYVVNMRR